jgi:HEPN domain-containing protein
MPASDDVLRVVAEWISKADSDLRAATITLRVQRACPTDAVCFHAQQCIEKYLKALLILSDTPFPKTHDLGSIAALLPDAWRPDVPPRTLERFTDYATITRYPGDYAEITLAEARAAVATARKIRKGARTVMPAAALRKRRW